MVITRSLPELAACIGRRARRAAPSANARLLRGYQGLDWRHRLRPEPLSPLVELVAPTLTIVHWPRQTRFMPHEIASFGLPLRILDGRLTEYGTVSTPSMQIGSEEHHVAGTILETAGTIASRTAAMTLHISPVQ